PTMGFGHQANLARRWPARRLSAAARATDGNAYGKGGTKAQNGRKINPQPCRSRGRKRRAANGFEVDGDGRPICSHMPSRFGNKLATALPVRPQPDYNATGRGVGVSRFESLVLQRQPRVKPTPRGSRESRFES